MKSGRMTINGTDVSEWGIAIDSTVVAAFMTPPAIKDLVESETRLSHGKALVSSDGYVKLDSREFTITIVMVAMTDEKFLEYYEAFCAELAKGTLDIYLSRTGVTYHCVYQSCTNLSDYFEGGMAKFTLKLVEPNPDDRS